jgi:SPP1 family predicted phage head-tail adaptor
MNSGSLRQYVRIEAKPIASAWGTEPAWAEFWSGYAKISFESGNENHTEDQRQSKNTGSAIIRYQSGIVPRMRLTYGDRLFEITSVINYEERSEYLKLSIEEINR